VRGFLLLVLILQQGASACAMTDAEKKEVIRAAHSRAAEYAREAAGILRRTELQHAGTVSPDAYETLRRSVSAPDWKFLLQSESTERDKADCIRKPDALALQNGAVTVFCDFAFDKVNEGDLPRFVLHEEVHNIQKKYLIDNAPDIECQASEMAGIVKFLAKDYKMEDEYTSSQRCAYVLQGFRNIQRDIKKSSTLLAAGQMLTIDPSLTVSDIETAPETYLALSGAAEAVRELKLTILMTSQRAVKRAPSTEGVS
jgi:hypothetical protein